VALGAAFMAEAAAIGNRTCGGKQFLSKKTRNGGRHDAADKRQLATSSLAQSCEIDALGGFVIVDLRLPVGSIG